MTGTTKQGRGLPIALQLVALFAAATSCTTDEGTRALIILQNQIPEVGDSGCVVPGKRTDLGPRGTLDVQMDRPRGYYLYPLVTNMLAEFKQEDPYNPSLVTLQGFDVELLPPAGITMPSDAQCPLNFFATDVESVLKPKDEVARAIQVILPCHAARMSQMFAAGTLPRSLAIDVVFTANVRARGKHGGSTVESAPYSFPVRVCAGCLQQGFEGTGYTRFGLDPASGTIAYPLCDQLTDNPYQGNPCNPAQDFGPILCCSRDSSGMNIECPGIARGAMGATTL